MASLPGKKIMRDVSLAFVCVHVIHHAAKVRIFGLEMMEELPRHGYKIVPGTLYPMLLAPAELKAQIVELGDKVLEPRKARASNKPKAR